MRIRSLIFIVLTLVMTGSASGQTPLLPQDNPLIGTWREHLKLGSMVVTFTDSTMSFSSADASGQIVPNSIHVAHVHYRRMEKAVGIAIEFDEQGGGGIFALLQSANQIVLDFPGMGAHHLEKEN